MPQPDADRRRFVRGVALVTALALGLRLAVFGFGPWQDAERAIRADSQRYVLLAHNLLTYQTFGKFREDGLMHQAVARLRADNGTNPHRDDFGLLPESFRTPGYCAFLAAVFCVVDDVRAALLVQCLVGGLSVALVAYIARRLGLSRRAALVASFLWAVHPALVLYDNLVLTENFFNFGAVVALALACRATGLAGVSASGITLGLTGLIRPVGLLYLPAVLAAGWGRQARRWLAACCLVVFAVLPSALWMTRNRAVGEGLRVSSVGDLNLLFYSDAYMVSEERGEDWFKSWPRRIFEIEQRLAPRLAPGEDVVAAARRMALSDIFTKPGLAAKVHLKSEVKLLLDHSGGDFAMVLGREYQPTGLFSRLVLGGNGQTDSGDSFQVVAVAAWVLFNASIVLAAAAGLLVAVWRRCYRLIVVCLPTILLFVAATGCVGLERFRLPVMLPLFLAAASLWGAQPVQLEQPREHGPK
jgi:hypothetical protein